MSLTPQAILVLIVYVLSLTVGTVVSFHSGQFDVKAAIALLMSLGFLVLLVYDTQCLTMGSCSTWSWVRSVLYVIVPVVSMIMLIVSAYGSGKNEKETKLMYAS